MNFNKMLQMQKELDDRIRKDHNLVDNDLINQKVLAFQVELGELANETRCFKYWSLKPPSDRAVILEEYVDGVHFLLSLALDLKVTSFGEVNILNNDENSLSNQFNKVFGLCYKLGKTKSEEDFVTLFEQYLRLGSLLEFNKEEIEHAYIGKNEVNHQRQNEGY
jgi:dimeric dUTPase (all-alpha-NTP-PPase superfamily)